VSDDADELWFYVRDYDAAKGELNRAYVRFGVEEHSAEPGQVLDGDADVTVRGVPVKVADFRAYLEESGIDGLMIEGEEVP
jgi:hypothetical protein